MTFLPLRHLLTTTVALAILSAVGLAQDKAPTAAKPKPPASNRALLQKLLQRVETLEGELQTH